jgi:uncharacterized UPF0160 family protein
MKNNNINTLEKTSDKSLEKVFKKYILEVDDAIEAHGFKASSYVDYAEDIISELKNSMQQQATTYGYNMIFIDLEDNLNNTISNIVNYTKQTAYERKEIHSTEKIEKQSNELYTLLSKLNTRFINSLETI